MHSVLSSCVEHLPDEIIHVRVHHRNANETAYVEYPIITTESY